MIPSSTIMLHISACTIIFALDERKLYNYRMGMQLIEKIRRRCGDKNYSIALKIREDLGIPITVQGIDAYERPEAQSMKLSVLCGLRRISGLSWSEFGKWLDDEFLPKK